MICKKCVHNEICNLADCCVSCKHFKDKDLVLKLPCKVGDIVYEISRDCIENECEHWSEGSYELNDSDCCLLDFSDEKPCEFTIHPVVLVNLFCAINILGSIGICVFLTEEEAEAKLKEINQ